MPPSDPAPAGAYQLPLFPLPLVLFPGAALPLHIFEPRYRQLLRDVQAGDGRFGIVLAAGPGAPAPGLVGCVARVRDVETLPDGRSNLVADGGARFAVVRLVDTDRPYAVAEVTPHGDAPAPVGDDPGTAEAEERVRALFARVARAAARLADSDAPPPALPEGEDAAFAVAARVEFELADRQRVLASRSPAERLAIVGALLTRAVAGVEARAAVHTGARANGRGLH